MEFDRKIRETLGICEPAINKLLENKLLAVIQSFEDCRTNLDTPYAGLVQEIHTIRHALKNKSHKEKPLIFL